MALAMQQKKERPNLLKKIASEAGFSLPVRRLRQKRRQVMVEHRRAKPPKKFAYSQIFTNLGPM
jgi:hypothetical protein